MADGTAITLSIIALVLTVAGSAAGLAWWISSQFKEQRHDFRGRLRHRDRRILRLEYYLRDRLGFDLSSDLPDLDD